MLSAYGSAISDAAEKSVAKSTFFNSVDFQLVHLMLLEMAPGSARCGQNQ